MRSAIQTPSLTEDPERVKSISEIKGLGKNHKGVVTLGACEGLPGVYSTIWCLCYKTNELKKKKQKEKHWACLHRLKKKGVAFVAAEHGSVEPSRSTRHDVTCSNRRPGLRLRARAICLTGKVSRARDLIATPGCD